MIAFSNAKINIGLRVLSKREDGYHNIQSVFYPIPFTDVLEIIEAKTFGYFSSGLAIVGSLENNTCYRVYCILKKDFPTLPFVHIYHYKRVPMGAGLGGGSANAAFLLKMLNDYFHLGLSLPVLRNYAAKVSADSPFFIEGCPAFVTGIGDVITPIIIDLSAYDIVLCVPDGISVSSAQVYQKIIPKVPAEDLRTIITRPVTEWKYTVKNDFEEIVFKSFPYLKKLRERLYKQGALFSGMTGSGAAIFALYPKNGFVRDAFFGSDVKIYIL